MTILKPLVEELDEQAKQGFACNTSNCPSSAIWGLRCTDDNGNVQGGYRDVRCDCCAEELKWVEDV